jgi:outer membrane protein
VAARAQMKIAHINQAELLNVMPDAKQIDDSINTVLEAVRNEYQLMVGDYLDLKAELDNNPSMLKTIRDAKLAQLASMQENIAQFEANAQAEIAALQDTLLAPILARVKRAIDEVCLEKGYNYVFDTSLGNPIFTDPKHDILADVKKKLGIP